MALVGAELREAFTTSRTAIGFLGRMDTLVACEGRGSGETFPALRAEEGALTRVGPVEQRRPWLDGNRLTWDSHSLFGLQFPKSRRVAP